MWPTTVLSLFFPCRNFCAKNFVIFFYEILLLFTYLKLNVFCYNIKKSTKGTRINTGVAGKISEHWWRNLMFSFLFHHTEVNLRSAFGFNPTPIYSDTFSKFLYSYSCQSYIPNILFFNKTYTILTFFYFLVRNQTIHGHNTALFQSRNACFAKPFSLTKIKTYFLMKPWPHLLSLSCKKHKRRENPNV